MQTLLLLGVTSLILSLVLTPIVRVLVTRLGLVDEPDAVRKVHRLPTPRMGGVAIWLSYIASLALLLRLPFFNLPAIPFADLEMVWKLLPAAGVVFLVGLLDDVRGLRPRVKLAGQTAAAIAAFYAGVRIQAIGGFELAPWLSFAVTVMWLLACTNAFNLIDGLDGLAAGIGLFATVTILAAAIFHGNMELAALTAPLAGCLLGFLVYNSNPASIFLGDGGSLLLGFLLGSFGIVWSHKVATLIGLAAPILVLAIPLLDMVLAIVRRFIRLRSIFKADGDHIHHRLLARGLSPRNAVFLLYGFCALAATLSIFYMYARPFAIPVLLVFAVAAFMGIRRLGYAELSALGHRGLRTFLSSQASMKSFEQQLVRAETETQCWEAIRTTARQMGFDKILLQLGDKTYEDGDGTVVPGNCWHLQIPLSEKNHIEFYRRFHRLTPQQNLTGSFVELIHSRISLGFRDERAPILMPLPVSGKPAHAEVLRLQKSANA